MKQYICTKLVQAEPAYMVNGKLVLVDKFDTPMSVPPNAEVKAGYKVCYPNGYESWSPRDVFERAYYLPLVANPVLKSDQPSISEEMVNAFIDKVEVQTMGEKTTVVHAVLKNGFELVSASSCVSPENYSEEMGKEICLEDIKNAVWRYLGFLLQTAVAGVQGVVHKE